MTRGGRILVIGTMDTKAAELGFVRDRIHDLGGQPVLVDVSTSGKEVEGADVTAATVATSHPEGATAVFTGERGAAVAAMSEALHVWLGRQQVAGAIGLGGSGGTALLAPALRTLPVGIPKLIVSTVASGDVGPHVGTSDLIMVPSVTDIGGLNRVSRPILANAAAAIAGMVAAPPVPTEADRPALGLTMFGVTTPCVAAVTEALERDYDCIVFHATGTGGRAMEDLAVSGRLDGILDLTTTELCDRLAGGIMPAAPDRIERLANLGLPYLGSAGALDMVNFAAPDTVPDRYADRHFHHHNPQITLMRTTAEECDRIGREIGAALNRFIGPAVFLIPEGGVSALDLPGQPFHDPEADAALFAAIEETLEETQRRRAVRFPHNINDAGFAEAAVSTFRALMNEVTT